MKRMGCLLWEARESGKTANVSEQGLMKLKNHPDARGSSIYPSQQDSGSQQPRVLQALSCGSPQPPLIIASARNV